MALDLILISLAIALDPLAVSAFVIVLSSQRGLRKGAGFLLGWVLSLVAVVAITILATGDDPPRSNTGPAVAMLVVKLVLGALLVAIGVRHQRRLGKPRPPKKTPKWQASVDSMSVLYAGGVAVVVQPMALVGAGIATITAARISSVESAVVLAAFCLVASASIAGLELFARLRPEKAERLLKRVLSWLERNTDLLIVVVSISVGLYLMGSSSYHLAAG
jgi:hypothetical protein